MSRVVSIHQNERLTYYDLDQQSNRLARGIESIGVKKGDRVAVSLGNNVEHAVVCTLLLRSSHGDTDWASSRMRCSRLGLYW